MKRDESTTKLLIIYTRFPQPGATKTRLIPHLGAKGAAKLQQRMTEHIFALGLGLHNDHNTMVEVHYDGDNEPRVRAWVPPQFALYRQVGETLGERMQHSFEHGFAEGGSSIILVGSDCPSVTRETLNRGFALLRSNDLVLGPARDGGYYLIGLTRTATAIWQAISWGTETVLAQTLEQARSEGLRHALLGKLCDIDRPDDLAALPEEFQDFL